MKIRGIRHRLTAVLTAGLLTVSAAVFPGRAAADGGDVLTALVGLFGAAGMYSGYLSAMLDAGNNALYQEQTLYYDRKENGISKNPFDKELVDSIMTRLVMRGEYAMDIRSLPFRWQVNGGREFNAACFPTDHVTVNEGLIRGVNRNVDELAAVLGHEMTHGLKLHAAYTYARAAAQSFGINFISMATGAVRPDVAGVLADYSVAKNVILPVEYEADEGGFYLASSAGFNPGGGAAAMARMWYLAEHPADFDRSYGADAYDHPDTDKREARLAQLMTDYSAGHVTVRDRKEILIDGEPLLTASYSTTLYDDTPEQAYLIAGGLARAFHDFDTLEEWNFRPGENGRIEYLSAAREYEPLKAAVMTNHAAQRLRDLVTAAYAKEPVSGARKALRAAEAKRQAEREARQAKARDASDSLVERLYHNADWYNDVYRPEMALIEVERALSCDRHAPKLAGLYAVRGRAQALQGDFAAAMADCDKAVELDGKDPFVYLNRAEVYRAQGQPEAALADIRRATEAKDDTLAAWKMAGDIEDELGDKQAALEDYRRYVKLAPEATDIGDEYLKELSPKVWEKVEKARQEAEEETIKAVKKKMAEKEKEKSSADTGKTAEKDKDESAGAEEIT